MYYIIMTITPRNKLKTKQNRVINQHYSLPNQEVTMITIETNTYFM